MCGFVALYNKKKQPVAPNALNQMTSIIAHRGPDDEGHCVDNHVGLGFRQLNALDRKTVKQPLRNEHNDVWIAFNGAIYNHEELKKWLKERGRRLKNESDAEIVALLYEEIGFDCPRRLRGMFAFVIWDRRKQILFGARDHFGIKPFYWTETPSGYAFGSEIKSLLLAPGTPRKVNPTAFYHYLTFQYVPEPDTMFVGVQKLPAAHRLIIDNGNLKIEPYWSVEFIPEDRPFSYFVEGTREVLKESVDLHRARAASRGAFLSSGIDSSSIVALMSQYETVETFTVGFDIPGYSELDIARDTANYLKTNHHELNITAERYLSALPRLIWHQDEPIADPSAIALYFAAELASRRVKVALSGEGADEFFGGYNIYREPHSLRFFKRLPSWARSSLGAIAALLPDGTKGKSFLIRGSKEVEDRFYGNALIFSEELKQKIVAVNLNADPLYREAREVTAEIYRRARSYDDVAKMQYLDIHTWMRGNILMKADKMSMANSLELRVPFVDPKVFEFAATIPTKYKIARGTTKYVLREAMKDLLPPQIKSRKKLGFPVPTRHWLRRDFYDWAKTVIHESETDEWINKSFALKMLNDHKAGRADYGRKIWTALVFMLWHQIYIEQKMSFDSHDNLSLERKRRAE